MSKNYSLNDKVRLEDDVLLKKLEDTCVLFNLANNSYYGLDATGYHFYLKLIEAENIQGALDALAEEYLVEKDVLKDDLLRLIDQLIEAKAVSIDPLS